jgi:transcriptional regulator with XRE-family HTH domain
MDKDRRECRLLLGLNIKMFRNMLGLTQAQLALELGISTTFLSDIETGKKWVSEQTLLKTAKALKVEIYELFKPKEDIKEYIDTTVIMNFDYIKAAIIKSIEETTKLAVKRSVTEARKTLKNKKIE